MYLGFLKMEINNPNLLFPGDPLTLNRQFKRDMKSILSRGSDEINESSNSDDDMGVVDYREMFVTMDYINSLELKKPVYSDEVNKGFYRCEVRKGATFDLLSLLSKRHNNSNHLLRVVNGEIQRDQQVQLNCLKGKFVLVCCVFAPYLASGTYAYITESLSLLSRELSLRSDVEIVLVIKVRPEWSDYQSVATHFVSAFSCLVVPFDHLSRIDSICMSLNLGAKPTGMLIDGYQVVIQDTLGFVSIAGMDAFPFTDLNLCSYRSLIHKMKSLEQILSSNLPASPYRICHGKLEVASVSELGKKLVGLYLLTSGADMPMIRNVYRQCQDRGLEFEVVVLCMPIGKSTTPQGLEHALASVLKEKKLPWWVFPFNTTVFHRLHIRSCFDVSDRLFIVLPNGKLLEPHGELVTRHFGIDAYPFTRESVIMKALYKLRRLTLESSLQGGFLYRGRDWVPVAHLRGRNVILCLDWVEENEDLYALLIRNYSHLKAKDPYMEVVYACLDTHISHIGKRAISYMPWLVYLRDPSKSEFVADDLFVCGLKRQKLVSFGKDGRISSLDAQFDLRRHGPAAFPFCGDLVEEVCDELNGKDNQMMYEMVWSDRSPI